MLRLCRLVFGLLVLLASASTSLEPARGDQTVVVVLDDSGSMERAMQGGQRRIVAAKQALATVLEGLGQETQVGVLSLNSRVDGSHWIVPVGSADRARWKRPLEQVRARGGTPLGEFVRQGADELLALRAKHPFATYRLLVVTDGEANDADLLNGILPDMLSRGLNLDVIGVDMVSDHSLARSAHSYRRAGDQAALTRALSEVFAETAGDDQASQADFELLAGLPDDAAAAIVKGLTSPRNDPLEIIDLPADMPAAPHAAAPVAAAPGAKQFAVGTVFTSLCCVGVFGATMLIIAVAILQSAKKNSRR